MHSPITQRSKSHNQRCDSKHDHTADRTGNYRHLQHSGSVYLWLLQIAFSHNISKKNRSRTGNGKAENRADVTDNRNQWVGSNCICTKMAKDYRVHRECHTPGNVISKCRKWKFHKVTKQHLTADKHISQIQLYILAQERYDHAGSEFYQPGSSCRDSNTCSAKLWCSK